MMIEELTRAIVNKHQDYLHIYSIPDKKVLKKMPVVSYDVVRETILNTFDFLRTEKIDKELWAGRIAENVADVTGIEYLDVYKVILNNGGKQWTTT